MAYTVALPHYSIGPDCYQLIPDAAKAYGTRAVVIGGKTAMTKARPYLEKALAGSGLVISDYLWFGGDSSYENGDRLIQEEAVKQADLILGVGGGRACDTAKYVADRLRKPIFTLPTLASNCAAVTGLSVIYNPDGTMKEYYYPKPADHCFINTSIIADSPYEYLWAGIGDALSKEFEVVFASEGKELSHSPALGVAVSHACTEPLLTYGEAALRSVKDGKESHALEQVALDIIISTGIVSLLTSKKGEYYYNASLAHAIYYGSTVIPAAEKHLHGEIVSLGTLCLEEYTGAEETLKRLMAFSRSIGLPLTFEEIGISENDFPAMFTKMVTTQEWESRPDGVTEEDLAAAMHRLNEKGRAFLNDKK